ncbi:hypothetical protein QFZ60_001560 [Arthrobacter sp. B2I5]|uniref:ERF family protein n=1 Tax=Arthrobacter sp. B2I5 TaxID=3042266 RepID=UPI00278176A4|nr:ERF family protein [Arthrobacter sp. B2I5]MDQ0825387.1 hypothetical protein [Arthrobacter sp. B2I5]
MAETDKDVSPETVQALSPTHMQIPAAIAAAIVKVQLEVKAMGKTAKNGHFNNTYAPLDEVMDTALPLLAKNKLGLMQWPITFNGKHYLHTVLVHETGVSMQSDIELLLVKQDPQGLGSSLTYTKRQTVMAILGLSAKDEDDDGNKASNHLPAPTQEQIDQIVALCRDLKYPEEEVTKRLMSIRTADHATVAINKLNMVISARAKEVIATQRAIAVSEAPDTPEDIPVDSTEQVQQRLLAMGFKDNATIKAFIRTVTKKPLLGNCKAPELKLLNEAMDRFERGEEKLPEDWFTKEVSDTSENN